MAGFEAWEAKKVSVVLPTYNGSRYLRESIDSILAQSYPNWELILVDDCSSDETNAICRYYCSVDPRVSLISNKRNLRLPASLNRGFAASEGELLVWTSDDNRMLPEFMDTFVAAFNDDPGLALAYSDYEEIDESGNVVGSVSLGDPCDLVKFNTVGCSFMYSRSLAAAVGGYDRRLFLVEDYDYWLRCLPRGKFDKISKVLYQYRLHPGSLTQRKESEIEARLLECLAKNLRLYMGSPVLSREMIGRIERLLPRFEGLSWDVMVVCGHLFAAGLPRLACLAFRSGLRGGMAWLRSRLEKGWRRPRHFWARR
jgi:glycosyltransferase involved in cell wall biosynthesis